MPRLNRFEWLKAVLQCADLNSSTKAVASALSVQFANDKTGQLNPSLKTLDQFLAGMSLATIKRCLRQLVDFGWLYRTEGRGAGNCTEYDLRAPCKILPFRSKKNGASASFSKPEKGASVTEERLTGELSYVKEKQSTEQNPALEPDLPNGGSSGPARGESPQAVFVPRSSFGCRQWEAFTEQMFGTWIERTFSTDTQNGEPGYWLPNKFPPTNRSDWPATKEQLICSGWSSWANNELGHTNAL